MRFELLYRCYFIQQLPQRKLRSIFIFRTAYYFLFGSKNVIPDLIDISIYWAPIVSLFCMLNICSIYVKYSFYISNICSVFQIFVPYFKYLFYISNIYSQFEIFVPCHKTLCYISNICSVLKWFYSLPSLFCISISILCFKCSFCISNIHSNCKIFILINSFYPN